MAKEEFDVSVNSRARRVSEMLAEAKQKKVFNASDPGEVQEQNDKAAQRIAQNAQVLLNILAAEPGRAWLSDFLVFCDVGGNPFVAGDSNKTAFNCGMQNAGKKLLNDIFEIAPEQYPAMLREAQRRMND